MWLTLEGTRNGRDFFDVTLRLPDAVDRYADKREAAITALAERWVCDRSRYVARGDYSQHESHGADVAATWARYREKNAPTPKLIVREGL